MRLFKRLGSLVAAGVLITPLVGYAGQTPVSEGKTAGLVSTISKLAEVEYSDRMEAMSHTSDSPTLDHYYDTKAEEVAAVIGRLQRGENVDSKDIQQATDNSEGQMID